MQSLIHSFNKYLLNAYFVPGTVIGTKDICDKIDENSCYCGTHILLGKGRTKINIHLINRHVISYVRM